MPLAKAACCSSRTMRRWGQFSERVSAARSASWTSGESGSPGFSPQPVSRRRETMVTTLLMLHIRIEREAPPAADTATAGRLQESSIAAASTEPPSAAARRTPFASTVDSCRRMVGRRTAPGHEPDNGQSGS